MRLPPVASPEAGYPLIPREAVAHVIDTKTYFAFPELKKYASKTLFNLANDCGDSQLEFLGKPVSKTLLIASSTKNCDTLFSAGACCGLSVFSLGRSHAGPVADGPNRVSSWKLERFSDGAYPLQRFKSLVLLSVNN